MNFPPKMIEILCCPSRLCRGDLEYAKSNDKEWLRCVECGAEYSIVHGIPILFPNAEYAEELHGRHWDQEMNAKSYSDKYEKNLAKQGTPWGQYTHQSEIEAVDALLDDVDLSGKYILDCGCGNGRFLRLHSEASVRIGLDASLVLLVETKKREIGRASCRERVLRLV